MPANDLSIYHLDMDSWWDRRGPMAGLHWLTPARFSYFHGVTGPVAGKRVLDVGCGGGLLAERFAAAGAQVVGGDLLWPCVAAAAAHALRSHLSVNYAQMAAERLALADQTFDIVVAADVLEHVAHLPRAIKEIGRVLREDGIFLFDTINRTWLARLVLIGLGERLMGVLPPGTHDWHKFIKPRDLSGQLKSAGLKLEQVTGLGPIGYWRGRLHFGRLPFTWLSYMGWARRISSQASGCQLSRAPMRNS
jgi:2-polyprenyl-6-hydroxyphenyl methylase/3-demethylubiquinone-9 3-methyltransferase